MYKRATILVLHKTGKLTLAAVGRQKSHGKRGSSHGNKALVKSERKIHTESHMVPGLSL